MEFITKVLTEYGFNSALIIILLYGIWKIYGKMTEDKNDALEKQKQIFEYVLKESYKREEMLIENQDKQTEVLDNISTTLALFDSKLSVISNRIENAMNPDRRNSHVN